MQLIVSFLKLNHLPSVHNLLLAAHTCIFYGWFSLFSPRAVFSFGHSFFRFTEENQLEFMHAGGVEAAISYLTIEEVFFSCLVVASQKL